MDDKNQGFGGNDGMGAPDMEQTNPEMVEIEGMGPVPKAEVDKMLAVADQIIQRMTEKVVDWPDELIIETAKREMNRADLYYLKYLFTGDVKAKEMEGESILIASAMEQALRERHGIPKERCDAKDCEECPIKAMLFDLPAAPSEN